MNEYYDLVWHIQSAETVADGVTMLKEWLDKKIVSSL